MLMEPAVSIAQLVGHYVIDPRAKFGFEVCNQPVE